MCAWKLRKQNVDCAKIMKSLVAKQKREIIVDILEFDKKKIKLNEGAKYSLNKIQKK